VGNLRIDGSQHRAGDPCCTKALTRKRPIPGGAIAKVASCSRSNPGLPIVHDRTHEAGALLGAQVRSDCGLISPSILMAGGKPAVMKQVRTFLLDHAPQQILHQAYCLIAFHSVS